MNRSLMQLALSFTSTPCFWRRYAPAPLARLPAKLRNSCIRLEALQCMGSVDGMAVLACMSWTRIVQKRFCETTSVAPHGWECHVQSHSS
jgi:hypothetical protein